MELVNRTGFPALMFRSSIEEDRFAAAVVVRVTYDLLPEGRSIPSAEQVWNVSLGPQKTSYGMMPSDELFYREGTDLFVFGRACHPGGRLGPFLEIGVQISEFVHRLWVYGDRIWERRGSDLVPSAPKPFREVTLTNANSYGGKDRWDGLEVPFSDNPDGKGFFLEAKNAEGGALPNIENPAQPIGAWNDQAEPVGVGFCPMTHRARFHSGLELDAAGDIVAIRGRLFNAAYPAMIVPDVRAGDVVRLSGMSEDGSREFSIPRDGLLVRLRFGDEVTERRLNIDQVGIEVDRSRFFVSYRYPFRYTFYRMQQRTCELIEFQQSGS